MLQTEIGALMRYADELVDCRLLPGAAPTILTRLVFRYRPRDGLMACVGLDELAGCGFARGTVIRILAALERVHIVFKERWGVVRNGRWRQMPNRYWLRTADEAKAEAIAEAEAAEAEVEIAVVTPAFSSSESNSCTDSIVLLESLPSSLPGEPDEKELWKGPPRDPCRTESDGDAAGRNPGSCQGRPAHVGLGGGVPSQHGGYTEADRRARGTVGEAGRRPAEDRGQSPAAGARDGASQRPGWIDLLAARRAVIEARMLR